MVVAAVAAAIVVAIIAIVTHGSAVPIRNSLGYLKTSVLRKQIHVYTDLFISTKIQL